MNGEDLSVLKVKKPKKNFIKNYNNFHYYSYNIFSIGVFLYI